MQVPAHFEYERATSVGHALALLAKFGPESRVLAGGHSLIPMMKLRLAQPETLIDINDLAELGYLRVEQGELRIGALTRHAELLGSPLAGQHFPILHDAERRIADPIVRNRGTVGGSLCQADPSEDLSAAFAAVRATMMIHGSAGSRTVPEREFHLGPYETVVATGELLTEIRVPKPGAAGWSFQKFTQRAIDWAIVGVAVQGGNVALVNMAGTPLRAAGVEEALDGGAPPAEAAARAAEGTSAASDIRASREYREHLARILVSRALTEATDRA